MIQNVHNIASEWKCSQDLIHNEETHGFGRCRYCVRDEVESGVEYSARLLQTRESGFLGKVGYPKQLMTHTPGSRRSVDWCNRPALHPSKIRIPRDHSTCTYTYTKSQ